jgi:hypothetical protein
MRVSSYSGLHAVTTACGACCVPAVKPTKQAFTGFARARIAFDRLFKDVRFVRIFGCENRNCAIAVKLAIAGSSRVIKVRLCHCALMKVGLESAVRFFWLYYMIQLHESRTFFLNTIRLFGCLTIYNCYRCCFICLMDRCHRMSCGIDENGIIWRKKHRNRPVQGQETAPERPMLF